MQRPVKESRGAPLRASGLGTLAVLVLLGVGVTAGYMQWKAPEVHAIVEGRKGEVAAVPNMPEARLVHWLKYSNALIHRRLQEMRFSADKPWLVAFAVAESGSAARGAAEASSAAKASASEDASSRSPQSGSPRSSGSSSASGSSASSLSASPGATGPEIYGIDLGDMPREPGRIEGLTIVVRLPRAQSLGRGQLTGDHAAFVPIVSDSQALPNADQRTRELAVWALQSLGEALERDIPGAHLSIEIGPEKTWGEVVKALSKDAREPPAAPRDGQ